MRSTSRYRQPLERVIGKQGVLGDRPLALGSSVKRLIISGFLSPLLAWLAVAVTVHHPPEWPRLAVSPGSVFASNILGVEPCGGILGCLFAPASRVQAANIALAVNTIFYWALLFGIVTTLSALWKKYAIRFAHVLIAVLVVSLTLFLTVSAFAQAPSSAGQKEGGMTHHARGPFDVKMNPQQDTIADGLTRMLIDKQYHGDLEATAKGEMLTGGMSVNKSGAYVAMEKVSGTLQGKTGTFVLHHTGIMNQGKPELTILVAPDSGTGQLASISGKMTINIAPDGKHSYDFEYTLPKTD
jgi:hypothetical protein